MKNLNSPGHEIHCNEWHQTDKIPFPEDCACHQQTVAYVWILTDEGNGMAVSDLDLEYHGLEAVLEHYAYWVDQLLSDTQPPSYTRCTLTINGVDIGEVYHINTYKPTYGESYPGEYYDA